ncbi:FAD-dependent oxidoreductase [Ahniella affigens]|nr:GMC family oxidoreductase [Ahniella affigens]
MLIDLEQLPLPTAICADVLVVGAGVAGLILARELADAGIDVAILESGGIEPEARNSDLSRGTGVVSSPEGPELVCDDYLHTSRERGVGGTLNLWGGKCGELDPVDFEQREWIPGSGWPFSKGDLQPFLDRACYRFGIPTFAGRRRQLEAAGAWVKINAERNFTSALRIFSGVTGTAPGEGLHQFKAAIAEDPNIRIYLHATVTELVPDASGRSIARLRVARPDGQSVEARAGRYVLAAGGLENPRLLLLSTAQSASGLGNAHDLVGRYFSGHGILRDINGPLLPPAHLKLTDAQKQSLALYLHKDPAHPQALLLATKGLQYREQTAGFAATLEPVEDSRCPEATPMFFAIEQTPNSASRVSLSSTADAFGCRRLHLEWRFNQLDLDSMRRSIQVLASDLQKAGFGQLVYQDDSLRLAQALELARHHMGTTRMHDDPTQGVVNRDCRLHGVDNLYVAGASVFPTSGVANPTLTLAALAIRLADHLRAGIGAGATRELVAAAT